MNIFIDELGKIYCEFRKGVFTPIEKEKYKELLKNGLINGIEICIGEINE